MRTRNHTPKFQTGLTTNDRGQKHHTSRAITSIKTSRPTRDWSTYNRQLVNRGNVFTIVLDVEALNGNHFLNKMKLRGRPPYHPALIAAGLTLRATFNLTYRATEGLLYSLLEQAGVDVTKGVPTYVTLQKNAVRGGYKYRPPTHSQQGTVLLVDGTGVSYYSTGEWNRKKHKVKGRNKFVRLTLTTDAKTGLVTSVQTSDDKGTGSGELSQLAALLDALPAGVYTTLIGDGAYDNKTAYNECTKHDMFLVAPPRSRARYGNVLERNNTLSQVNKVGLVVWKKRRGYHTRSLVEATIGALKSTLGRETRARTLAGAEADVVARVNVYNGWRLQELTSVDEVLEQFRKDTITS